MQIRTGEEHQVVALVAQGLDVECVMSVCTNEYDVDGIAWPVLAGEEHPLSRDKSFSRSYDG